MNDNIPPKVMAYTIIFIIMPLGGILMAMISIKYHSLLTLIDYGLLITFASIFTVIPMVLLSVITLDKLFIKFVRKGDNDK